jgi:hypothetical protein
MRLTEAQYKRLTQRGRNPPRKTPAPREAVGEHAWELHGSRYHCARCGMWLSLRFWASWHKGFYSDT